MYECDNRRRSASGYRETIKVKILFLINHLNTGGIASYALTLSSGLKERGHGVFIASSGGELLDKFNDSGIGYFRIPVKTKNELSPGIIISAFMLSKVIKENGIDIIHSHSRTTQVLGRLAQRLTGVKHIFTCHGFFKRRLSRKIFPCWPDKVIAISYQVREHLIRDFKLGPEKTVLVYNGIDTNRFNQPDATQKQEAKLRLGLRLHPVIGILARLSDVKGHKYLIRAMKKVLLAYSDAQLLIAGEGKMEMELKKLTGDLKIKESVFFMPNSLDTREILSAMDIFVLPSLKEGLGLALMEAMSMGLAVIGSDVGGIKTLIRDKDNGLLVNPGEPDGIARAIIELISDSNKAVNLGNNARKYIMGEFSRDKMVAGTEEVYRECLGEAYK